MCFIPIKFKTDWYSPVELGMNHIGKYCLHFLLKCVHPVVPSKNPMCAQLVGLGIFFIYFFTKWLTHIHYFLYMYFYDGHKGSQYTFYWKRNALYKILKIERDFKINVGMQILHSSLINTVNLYKAALCIIIIKYKMFSDYKDQPVVFCSNV